jgi:ABC-type transporter Mla maintaining outer membrane lipid asymmetry ATPase subunit MlaF
MKAVRPYAVGAPVNDRLQLRAAISIRGLTKCYSDNTVANKGIDLDVFEGETFPFLGPMARAKPRW